MDLPPSTRLAPQATAAGPIPVSHHLLLCATPSKALCCPDPAIGAASWDALKRLVRELGLEDPARPGGIVLRSKADCLRICSDGPVLLIWPDGIVYGGVTPERIERILREHLQGGCPIPDWIVRDYSLRQSAERRSAHKGPHGRIPAGPNETGRW